MLVNPDSFVRTDHYFTCRLRISKVFCGSLYQGLKGKVMFEHTIFSFGWKDTNVEQCIEDLVVVYHLSSER